MYIQFNPKKLQTGTYLSYKRLLRGRKFVRIGGLKKDFLDDQVHGLVTGEIPRKAIEVM